MAQWCIILWGCRIQPRGAEFIGASGAELLFMRFQGAYDLVAVHGFILPMPLRQVKALDVVTRYHALPREESMGALT